MNRKQSSALMQRACRTIPGGVNSPVRAFKGAYWRINTTRNGSASTLHQRRRLFAIHKDETFVTF